MVSADQEDHVSSADRAPQSTSSHEESVSKPIVKSESGYSDSLMGRFFSTLFPVSSTASEAPSPRRSRRRSFVPIISPTPRSPCHTGLSSSRNSPRLPEHQGASPPTQEATTDGRGMSPRTRHRRPLRLGKFHEQLPRKALSAIYANSESLLRLCPQTEGSSSTSSAGTSSSGSHSGRPAGTSTVSQRRYGTFWESLPWRRPRHSEAISVSENFSERRDAESTGSAADRRAPERRVGDAEDAASSMTPSYYSSSGSLSPRYQPNGEARRFPIPVPVLDFSWLEKIATKRESRGLPPQPHMCRPVLHKKRASMDEFAKLSARLKKQQLSILRESSLLATRRSAKSSKRVLSRRATVGTIGQRELDRCFSPRGSSPCSDATVRTSNRSATFFMANSQGWSLDSLKGIKGAGRGRRRFYCQTAAAVGAREPRALNNSIAKKRDREILSLSSSLAFEPREKFFREKDDQSCVTPKSPLSWLSQDERRSRARDVHLDTDSDAGHAAVGNDVEEITSAHRTPRRRHSASSIHAEEASTVRATRHHMDDERRDLCSRDGCSPEHSGSLMQPDLGDGSARARLSNISVCRESLSASSHQHCIEESAIFSRQSVSGKIVYTLSKKGSEKKSMRGGGGLLIAVEPVLERRRRSEGRGETGRVLTVANDEESASDSARERTPSAARNFSPRKLMAVDDEGHNGRLRNAVSRGSAEDQTHAAETCERASVRQKTQLHLLRRGERRRESAVPTSDLAKEDKFPFADYQHSKGPPVLSRGRALDTAAVLKQRRESSAEDKNVRRDRNGKKQENQQVTVNRQIMKKEHLKTFKHVTSRRERRADFVTNSKTAVFGAASSPTAFPEKEATANVRRNARAGITFARKQFSRAEQEGVHLEKIYGSETSVNFMEGLRSSTETDTELAGSADKYVKEDASRYHNEFALTSKTSSPAVVHAGQRECEIDVRQFSLEDVTRRSTFPVSAVMSSSKSSFPSQVASPASSSKEQKQVEETGNAAVALPSSTASGVCQQADLNGEATETSIVQTPIPHVIGGVDGTWAREKETTGEPGTVDACKRQRYKKGMVLRGGDRGCSIQETDRSAILPLQPFRELVVSKNIIDAEQGGPQCATFLMPEGTTCGREKTAGGTQGDATAPLFNPTGGATLNEERQQDSEAWLREKERVADEEYPRSRELFPGVASVSGDQQQTTAQEEENKTEPVLTEHDRQRLANRNADNGWSPHAEMEDQRQQNDVSRACFVSDRSLEKQTKRSTQVGKDEINMAERSRDVARVRPAPVPVSSKRLREVEKEDVVGFNANTESAEIKKVESCTDKSRNLPQVPNRMRNEKDLTTVIPVGKTTEAHAPLKAIETKLATAVTKELMRERGSLDEKSQKDEQGMICERRDSNFIAPAVTVVECVLETQFKKNEQEEAKRRITEPEGAFGLYTSHKSASLGETKMAAKPLADRRGRETADSKETTLLSVSRKEIAAYMREGESCGDHIREESIAGAGFSVAGILESMHAEERRKQEVSDNTVEPGYLIVTPEREGTLPTVPEDHEMLSKQGSLRENAVDASSEDQVALEVAAMNDNTRTSTSVSDAAKTAPSRGVGECVLEKDGMGLIPKRSFLQRLLEKSTSEAAVFHKGLSVSTRRASGATEKKNTVSSRDEKDICMSSDEVDVSASQKGTAEDDAAEGEIDETVVAKANAQSAVFEDRSLRAVHEKDRSSQEVQITEGISSKGPVIEEHAAGRVRPGEDTLQRSSPENGVNVLPEAGCLSSSVEKPNKLEEGISAVRPQQDAMECRLFERVEEDVPSATTQQEATERRLLERVEEGVPALMAQQGPAERRLSNKETNDVIPERGDKGCLRETHLTLSQTREDTPLTYTLKKETAEGYRQEVAKQLSQHVKWSKTEPEEKIVVYDQKIFIEERQRQPQLKMNAQTQAASDRFSPASGDRLPEDRTGIVSSASNFRETQCYDVTVAGAQGFSKELSRGRSLREASDDSGTADVVKRGRCRKTESFLEIESVEAVGGAFAAASKDSVFQSMQQKRSPKGQRKGGDREMKESQSSATVGKKDGEQIQTLEATVETGWREVTAEKGIRHGQQELAKVDDDDDDISNQKSVNETPQAAVLKSPMSEEDICKSEGPTLKLYTGEVSGVVQKEAVNKIPPPGAGAEKSVYTAAALDDGPPSAGSRSSVDSREVWVAEENVDEELSNGERGDGDATASAALVTGRTDEDKETILQARDRHQLPPEDTEEETDKVVATRTVARAAKKCVLRVDLASTRRQTHEHGTKDRGAYASLEIPTFATDDFPNAPTLPPVTEGKEDGQRENIEGATAQRRPNVESPGGKNIAAVTAREIPCLDVESSQRLGSLKRPDSTSVSVVASETCGEKRGVSRRSEREVTKTASRKHEDGATVDPSSSSHDYGRQQRCLMQPPEKLWSSSQVGAVPETMPDKPGSGQQRGEPAVSWGELMSLGESMACVVVDSFHRRAPGSHLQSTAEIVESEGTKSKPGQSPAEQNDNSASSVVHSQRKTFGNHSATRVAQSSTNRESHVERRLLLTSQVVIPVKTAQAEGAREQEGSSMSLTQVDSKCVPDTVSAPVDSFFQDGGKDAAPDREDHVFLDGVPQQLHSSQETDVVKRTQRIHKADEGRQTADAQSFMREQHAAADVSIMSKSTALNGGETLRGRGEEACRASFRLPSGLREVVVENTSVDSRENSAKVTIVGDQQEGASAPGTTQHAHPLLPKLPAVADFIATTPQAATERPRVCGRTASVVKQSDNQHSPSQASNITPIEASGQPPADAAGEVAETDTGEVRPMLIERAAIGAAESQKETETGEATSPALSFQKRANAAKLFLSGPSIEEGKRRQASEVPMLDTGDEMDRWDSTMCPSPPFSPRYIPPACPPFRPAVPPLNLYWLRDRRHGPEQKKRLKDLVKTLHADGVCQASPPQIAAVSLQADPPLQSDDDRKKADIVASLLVDDPVVDLDTDLRKHQPVLSSDDGPQPPCVASTRSYLLTTPLQTPWQRSLDLEKSPELKAPRGEHPPIFRGWETAEETVHAAPERATSETNVSSQADEGDVEKHLPLASILQEPKRLRSGAQTRQPVVLGALPRSSRSHGEGQPGTFESPLSPVEAPLADERQNEVLQAITSSRRDGAAKTESVKHAYTQSLFTRQPEDRFATMALRDVSLFLQDKTHLQQPGKHKDEAVLVECPVKLPGSCRDSIFIQCPATGTLGTATVEAAMQREKSSVEHRLSRHADSLERFKNDSAVRSLSLPVAHPITSSCANKRPITVNESQKWNTPDCTGNICLREKHRARTRVQGKPPIAASIRETLERKPDIVGRPHLPPAAGDMPPIAGDVPPAAGDTPAAPSTCEIRSPQVFPRPVEEKALWLDDSPRLPQRSLEEKPTRETEAAWTPQSPTAARAKARAAVENVLQLIKSATMLLRANEAMGTRTPAVVADVGTSRHGKHEKVKGKRTAVRPQLPPAYLEKLHSYEGLEKERSTCASAVESTRFCTKENAHSLENGPASEGVDRALADFCSVDGTTFSAAGRPACSDGSAFSAAPLTTAKIPHSEGGVGDAEFRSYSPTRASRKESVVAERIQSYEQMALRRQRVRRNDINSEIGSLRPKAKATKSVPTRGAQPGTSPVAAGRSVKDTQTKADTTSRRSSPLAPASAAATPEARTALKFAKGLTEASDTQDGIGSTILEMSLEEDTAETTRPPSSSFSGESTAGVRQAVTTRGPSSCLPAETDTTVSSRPREQSQGGRDCFACPAEHPLQSQRLSDAVRLESEHFKMETRHRADTFLQSEADPLGRTEATSKEKKRQEALSPSQTDVGGDVMVQSETRTPFFKATTPASSERQEDASSPKERAAIAVLEKCHRLQRDAVAGGSLSSTQKAAASPQLRAGNSKDVQQLRGRARLTRGGTQVTKLQGTKASSQTETFDDQGEMRPASTKTFNSTAQESRTRRRSSPVVQTETTLAERRGVHSDPGSSPAISVEAMQTQTAHEGGVSTQSQEMQVLQEDGVAVNQSALLETSSIGVNTCVDSGVADIGERARWTFSTSRQKDAKTKLAKNLPERRKHSAYDVTTGRERNTSVNGTQRTVLTPKRTTAEIKSPVAACPEEEKKLQANRRTRAERLIASVARLKTVASLPSSTSKKSGGDSSTHDTGTEKFPKHGSDGVISPLTEAAGIARACRHGDSKNAPKSSSGDASAHKRWERMRPRTSFEVSGSFGMTFAAGNARRRTPDRVSVRKAASSATAATRRASYQIIIPRARTAERSGGTVVSAGRTPKTRTRTCLSDSTAWKERDYEEPPDSVEEAKAIFLQSWWKAVTVRKWIDAAKCVRNFESSTSSMPSPSRFEAILYDVRTEDIAFPYVSPGDQEAFPSSRFQEDSSAARVYPGNYALSCSRRKSFADAFFEILAAENREKRARPSSSACLWSHPKVSLGRVESEPGCLWITQRFSQSNTNMTLVTPAGECEGEQPPKRSVVERNSLPSHNNVSGGNVKGSAKKEVALQSATSFTTRGGERKQYVENNLLPRTVARKLQAGEGCQFDKGGDISRCRHGIDSSENRASLGRLPTKRASFARGSTVSDRWLEEEYQPNKEGLLEYVSPDEGKQREAHTPQDSLVDGTNREEAQPGRKLPETPTESVRGTENQNYYSSGTSTPSFLQNKPQSRRRSYEEFRSRIKDKQWLTGNRRDKKIRKQTLCPRHGVGTEDSSEERWPQQLKSKAQTSAQKGNRMPKVTRERLSRSPKKTHSTITEQAACSKNEYEGDIREELLSTQTFTPGVVKGEKGSKEATETSSCELKDAGIVKVKAWDSAQVGARSVTEGSTVEQDMKVHTSLKSELRCEEETAPGDPDSCFKKATPAGNKNDIDDGEETAPREDYFRADKNHSDFSELKTRAFKELGVESKNCRQHEARLTLLKCESIPEEEDEPSEQNREGVTCGSVRRAEEQPASLETESEVQYSDHTSAKEKTLRTSAHHNDCFPSHSLHGSLTLSQHADQLPHHALENDDDDFIVGLTPSQKKRIVPQQKNSSRRWKHAVTTCEQWRGQTDQAPRTCEHGRTEVENMDSQPDLRLANGADKQSHLREYTHDNSDATDDADGAGMTLSTNHSASRVEVERRSGDVAVQGCTNRPSSNSLTKESLRERRSDLHDVGSMCNAHVSDIEEFLSPLDDDEEDSFAQLVGAKKASLL